MGDHIFSSLVRFACSFFNFLSHRIFVFAKRTHTHTRAKEEEEEYARQKMGGKKPSGAAKRKKKKEKEEAIERAREEMERLKLGPTKLWTGLVLHHRDIFVSHVLPKLNGTDRCFFAKANIKHLDLLKYAGVDVSNMFWSMFECTSVSTLEWAWINIDWGEEDRNGNVIDQA